jgi:hypothetical protein
MTQMNFESFIANLITTGLGPGLTTIVMVSRLMGIFFFLIAMTKAHKLYAAPGMGKSSPKSAFLFFIAGVVLIGFLPWLLMLSAGVVGVSNLSPEILNLCAAPSGGILNGNIIPCPMLAYANDVTTAGAGASVSFLMKEFAFALMTLIGVYSFVKGFVIMVKLGEGQQQATMGNVITHLLAGVVGVNGEFFYSMLSNFITAFGIN